MENSLARDLEIANVKAKYDENNKHILSDKEIQVSKGVEYYV